jgi:hypothetical protein
MLNITDYPVDAQGPRFYPMISNRFKTMISSIEILLAGMTQALLLSEFKKKKTKRKNFILPVTLLHDRNPLITEDLMRLKPNFQQCSVLSFPPTNWHPCFVILFRFGSKYSSNPRNGNLSFKLLI